MSHIYQHRSLVPISTLTPSTHPSQRPGGPRPAPPGSGANGMASPLPAAPHPHVLGARPDPRDMPPPAGGRATPLPGPVPGPVGSVGPVPPAGPGVPVGTTMGPLPPGSGVVVGGVGGNGPPGPTPTNFSAAMASAQAHLADVFETVKHEFDALGQHNAVLRAQREEMEGLMSNQVQEVRAMKQQITELENRHAELVAQYQEEIKQLRMMVGQRPGSAAFPTGSNPAVRNGMGYLDDARFQPFYSQPKGRMSPAPPPLAPGPVRDDRARDTRFPPPEAKRMRLSQSTADGPYRDWEQPGPGPQSNAAVHSFTPRPSLPEPNGQVSPPPGDRERDRDVRDARVHDVAPSSVPAAPPVPAPAPTKETAPVAAAESNLSLSHLSDLDPDEVPKALKTEGSDWLAIFNPDVPRRLKVNLVHTLAHESVVCCVRFSLDGKFLATGCNRSAQIYNTQTGAKVAVLADPARDDEDDLYIRSVCFSPDGKYLATGAEDRQVRIWDIAQRKVQHRLKGHQQEIYSLDWSLDGKIIASGSGDMTVRIWDVEQGALLHTLSTGATVDGHPASEGVTSVSINADSRLVAAGALDTCVRVWDAHTAQQVEHLEDHTDSIYSVAFSPDGQSLISGSLDKTVKRWDLSETVQRVHQGLPVTPKKETKVTTLVGHKDYVLSVSCSPDGEWIVSGSKDRGVMFWDPATAQTQAVLQGHKNSVIAINLSPAGGLLATGSGDFNARIWSYESAD